MREFHKCKECCCGGIDEKDRKPGQTDSKYWQKRVDAEECTAAFPTAIATLVEDTSEITLALYVLACHGEREDFIGEFSLPIKCFMVAILLSCFCRYKKDQTC